jgi:hypothetical protein
MHLRVKKKKKAVEASVDQDSGAAFIFGDTPCCCSSDLIIMTNAEFQDGRIRMT